MDEDRNQYVSRVGEDHYLHWLALVVIGIWAGTAFGWVTGVLTIVALIIAISVTNTAILAKTGSFTAVRYSRWAWLAFAALLIVAITVERVGG